MVLLSTTNPTASAVFCMDRFSPSVPSLTVSMPRALSMRMPVSIRARARPRRWKSGWVATFSFRLKDLPPRLVAEKLAEAGIYVWDGNYYAINVTERLGIEEQGGMVRVGAVHYNTLEEVERLREALVKIGAG